MMVELKISIWLLGAIVAVALFLLTSKKAGSYAGQLRILVVLGLTIAIGFAYVEHKIESAMPNMPHLPKMEGSTQTVSDISRMSSAFASAQGVDAGDSPVSGVDVFQRQKVWNKLPDWTTRFAGSCSALKDGAGIVRYHSDFITNPPVFNQTDTEVIIDLPEPTPRSASITNLDSNAIKNDRWCGLLVKQFPDVQAMNREVQRRVCEYGYSDTTHLAQRRADGEASAKALAALNGANGKNVRVTWRAVPNPAQLPECPNKEK